MSESQSIDPRSFRAGVVSFLNARPLIHGLDQNSRVTLIQAVPSRLPGMLQAVSVDVALVPVVDTVRDGRTWPIVSNACIGCHGATLTVRILSRVDPADIETLHVDGDSHTSIALASIIWREKYKRELRLIPWSRSHKPGDPIPSDCQAILLIGDKVIRPPVGADMFSTQIDLGATWKSLTGLPFVFAVWAVTERVSPADARGMADVLEVARDAGVANAVRIAADEGPRMGWPVELATRYLTEFLTFTLGPREREGMKLFLEMARKHDRSATAQDAVFA